MNFDSFYKAINSRKRIKYATYNMGGGMNGELLKYKVTIKIFRRLVTKDFIPIDRNFHALPFR